MRIESRGGAEHPLRSIARGEAAGDDLRCNRRGIWTRKVTLDVVHPERMDVAAQHDRIAHRRRRQGRCHAVAGRAIAVPEVRIDSVRSEEHTSELQSLMRISYAVFCLKKKKKQHTISMSNRYIPCKTTDKY